MARGIRKKDFWYEIDKKDNLGNVTVQSFMLISMDQYNVAAATPSKIAPSTVPDSAAHINAHIKLHKNLKMFGVHPRHAVLEWQGATANSACNGTTPNRFISVPILTLDQFATLEIYNEVTGGAQPLAQLIINHTFDGSDGLVYKIRKLVNQALI